MTADQARRAFEAAKVFTPEPPRPLMRELPPADPFPVDVLGELLVGAASAIHERVQAPPAICTQSVLAAATLAVQGHVNVELPTGQTRPLSEFFVTVAATGERKSACDGEALKPVRERERALVEACDSDRIAWQNDKDVWDKARSEILRNKKKSVGREVTLRALEELGPAPVPPLEPLLTCPEPTFEGLCKLLASGHPSVGVFSAEGGQFVGGHGMSEENRLRTAAGLSSVWDGEPIKRVRAGDGVTVLPGRRVSLHLMLQPDVATVLLSDRMLADQGLLSRLLVSAPDPAAGSRFWNESSPESFTALDRYRTHITSILAAPLPVADGKRNQLCPRRLPLSPSARTAWIKFADHIEGLIAPGGELEPIRGLANKLPEHAARLAAVLTLIDDISAAELPGEKMAAGIELAQHYEAEGLRLFAAGLVDRDLLLAQRLLDWLHNNWSEQLVSLPDIYQLGPNAIRDQRTAARLVQLLEEHGWLSKLEGGGTVAGKRRKDAWRIVKE